MARKRKKLTPFARLFIFLLFLAPIAYVGASYYKGEDGIQNIKNLVGLGDKGDQREKGFLKGNDDGENKELLDAYKQIEDLKRKLRDKDKTIQNLQEQIDNPGS